MCCFYCVLFILVPWTTCVLIIYMVNIASTATKLPFVGLPVSCSVRYMINVASTAIIVLFV